MARLGYRPALDGLRGVAIAAVVFGHAFAQPRGFNYGVDIFFVLSGFLITRLLLEERASGGRVDLRSFYGRRARRLMPALVALLAVYAVVSEATGSSSALVEHLGVAATYLTNIAVVTGHYVPGALFPLWSLAAEEQFYLLWPLLFVALFSLRPRWVTAVLGSLIAALAMWQLALVHGHASVDRVKFGPDTRSAVPLLVGCLSSTLLWFYVRPVRKVTTLLQPVALILVVALLATNSRPASPFHGGLLMVALACGCLLPVMVEEGTLLAKVLGNRPLVALGKISYSLYLWHVLCLVEISGFRFAKIVAIATAVVAAALSYRFVEQPFRKRRSLVPEARRTFRASPTPVEVPSR